jgi:transcriptional regulator with GAF, ATPase, and Fis domain
VDVRIIAATNRPLEDMVRARTFREDLFFRLNVFPITLPPLRERSGDIPLLCDHFVQKFAQSSGRPLTGLDPAALAELVAYPWPGNVRELENVIERGTILARGPVLRVSDLEFGRRGLPVSPVAGAGSAARVIAGEGASLHKRLSDQERAEIVAAVDRAEGNIAHAARALGINRSTLYYRMRKHGLDHLLLTRDEPPRAASED